MTSPFSLARSLLVGDTLHHLGFSVHPDKCNFIPLRSQEFLGTQVNSKTMQFRVPREKLRNIRCEIQSVLCFKRLASPGCLHPRKPSRQAQCSSRSGHISSAQMHLWPFHHLIKDVLKKACWVDGVSLDRPVIDEIGGGTTR